MVVTTVKLAPTCLEERHRTISTWQTSDIDTGFLSELIIDDTCQVFKRGCKVKAVADETSPVGLVLECAEPYITERYYENHVITFYTLINTSDKKDYFIEYEALLLEGRAAYVRLKRESWDFVLE